jgi:glutamate---cysteine ligase / carboxylate-amine ligase
VTTIGVEEELMILDAETFEPAAASHLLVGDVDQGTLKTELHASVVELTTPVCSDVDEVIASLRTLRRTAAERAAEHGLVIAAGGAHPTAALESLPVVQEERYLSMLRDVGYAARRQGVNGLHVHVGVPSMDECWERLESVLGWLPAVLALSCNSPFVDGVATGMLSNRAAILAELPRGGPPPAFPSFAEWEAWVDRLVQLGVLADYTRLWWDARPHPRLGTLEIRIADQPTSLERVALVVGAIRGLVERAPRRPTPRGDYLQNRWAAARHGVDAQLIHPDGTRLATVAELLGFDPPQPEATLRRSAPELAAETLRF